MILRYGVAGAINTAAAFLVYSGLVTWTPTPYWAANFFGISASLVCGFFLARNFVFRDRTRPMRSSGWRYAVAFVVQYAVGTAAIGLLMGQGVAEVPAYVIALPVMIVVAFTLQRYWVFASPR